jgi:hypothetical protein
MLEWTASHTDGGLCCLTFRNAALDLKSEDRCEQLLGWNFTGTDGIDRAGMHQCLHPGEVQHLAVS